MATVTINAAQDTLPQLVARAEAGEEIVLSRGDEPVAKIVPIPPKPVPKKRRPRALKGLVSIGPEFFEPLPEDELKAWDQ